MKRKNLMAIAAACFMMLAVCVEAPAKIRKTVERGMTKDEVAAILGDPKLTSFDSLGDRWQYSSQNILTGDTKYTTVIFDLNGRVVGLDTHIEEFVRGNGNKGNNANNANCHQPAPMPAPPEYNVGGYAYPLDDASFSKLYNKVRNASFNDTKFDLIEVASLGCWYSCAQTARMMRLFTFSDDRMRVLRLMASRIVDPQNSADIYGIFTFSNDKAKVGEILRSSIR